MGGGDSGCGIGLLRVTFNKLVTFPRQSSMSPFMWLMLLRLGNVQCNYNVLQISGMTLINGSKDSVQGFSVKLSQY